MILTFLCPFITTQKKIFTPPKPISNHLCHHPLIFLLISSFLCVIPKIARFCLYFVLPNDEALSSRGQSLVVETIRPRPREDKNAPLRQPISVNAVSRYFPPVNLLCLPKKHIELSLHYQSACWWHIYCKPFLVLAPTVSSGRCLIHFSHITSKDVRALPQLHSGTFWSCTNQTLLWILLFLHSISSLYLYKNLFR